MSHVPLETVLLREIRLDRAVSRVQLAQRLAVAPSTIGIHVERLLEQGYLKEVPCEDGTPGRPPRILEPDPRAGQFIGVDLDARRMHGVAVDFSQKVLHERSLDLPKRANAQTVLKKIVELIESVRDRGSKLLGIGLAVPGTLDAERAIGLHYRFIPGWRNVRLQQTVADQFSVPVYLENNVRVMALAERWFGRANAVENMLCIGIRSGIGAGIILNGELYRGDTGMAGEIGTWPVSWSSAVTNSQAETMSTPAPTVPLEDVASLRALVEQFAQAVGNAEVPHPGNTAAERKCKPDVEQYLQAVGEGCPWITRQLQQAAEVVGRVLVQLALLLNPRMILVSGPLAALEKPFLVPLRAEVARLLTDNQTSLPDILPSELGELAAAKGAAAQAVDMWRPEGLGARG